MPTRIIKAAISYGETTDLKDEGYARFSVTSDTGTVVGGLIVSARLTLSSMRSYSDSYYLQVKFDSTTDVALARTVTMDENSDIHAELVTLTGCQQGLTTQTPGVIYLVVQSTSGTGNKINFRADCTITLEIDYAHLTDYTDPEIIPGVTPVKAVHITELQQNATALREARGFVVYEFTPVKAQYTSLGGWTQHVMELREAIHAVYPDHEEWLEIVQNCPRADVLMQLRSALAAAVEYEGAAG